MRSSLMIATAISVFTISTAHAEMPYYDVDKYCKKIASMGGGSSQALLPSCYQQEQTAYNAVKPRWESLPAEMRTYCDQIAAFGGTGSYMLLESCIQQEEAAAGSNSGFQFTR